MYTKGIVFLMCQLTKAKKGIQMMKNHRREDEGTIENDTVILNLLISREFLLRRRTILFRLLKLLYENKTKEQQY